MLWFRVGFLLLALMTTSAYTFRCRFLCTDQTNIQEDYVAQRDQCRQLAELKTDTNSGQPDDNARQVKLDDYFRECMRQNGWALSSSDKKAAAPPPAPPPPEAKAALRRASECDFARANADVSSVAALRAKACDLECAQALKTAPEAPRPAACPAGGNDNMSEGTDNQ